MVPKCVNLQTDSPVELEGISSLPFIMDDMDFGNTKYLEQYYAILTHVVLKCKHCEYATRFANVFIFSYLIYECMVIIKIGSIMLICEITRNLEETNRARVELSITIMLVF